MTREEILQIGRKAGALIETAQEKDLLWLERYTELAIAKEREEFAVHAVDIARRAIAEEREACAKVADKISDKYAWGYSGNEVDTADEIANAIRARGKA